jgi:hypothetical protein
MEMEVSAKAWLKAVPEKRKMECTPWMLSVGQMSESAWAQTGGTRYVTDSMKAYIYGPLKPESLRHFLPDGAFDVLRVSRKALETRACPSLVPPQERLQTSGIGLGQRWYYAGQKQEVERV